MSLPGVSSTKTEEVFQKKSVNLFKQKYIHYCQVFHSRPLRGLKIRATNSSLDFIGDRIKYDEWVPLLRAISADRNLHYIALRSKHCPGTVILEHVKNEKQARELQKGSVLFTRFMLNKVVEAFADCIIHSNALMCLQFQSIPLQSDAMTILAQAISKAHCIQHLSFENCTIGDDGCNLVFQALKNQPSVVTLDLSNCNISEHGAYQIAELIKVQEIARYGECWKHSLRYREVSHEIIPGLRRISLNNNPKIGDEGLRSIVIVLCDDYWIKALDMQNCGITDLGCASIINLINMNNEIVVFDVRRNPIEDTNKMTEIIQILYTHTSISDRSEFGWKKIETSSSNCSSPTIASSVSSYKISPCNKKVTQDLEFSNRNVATLTKAKKKLYATIHNSNEIYKLKSEPCVLYNTSKKIWCEDSEDNESDHYI